MARASHVMAQPIVVRLELDLRECQREMDRLIARTGQDEGIREAVEHLLDDQVPIFEAFASPSICGEKITWRAELAPPYWYLLEREAV